MQTGSSGTLIGWKSGQTPPWDRMEGAWLWTLSTGQFDYLCANQCKAALGKDMSTLMLIN